MAVDMVRAAIQEFRYCPQLVCIEILQHPANVFSLWLQHTIDGGNFSYQMENLFALVIGIGLTTQISSPLEPANYSRDRTTRQAGDGAQFASGHRPAIAKQVETFIVRWPKAEALRQGVVKQNHCCSLLPHQRSNDFLDQPLSGPTCPLHQPTVIAYALHSLII